MSVPAETRGKYFTPRIYKEPMLSVIRTVEHTIVGNIYVRPEQRLKDELSHDSERFIAITEAHVYDKSDQLLFESNFLLVPHDQVLFLSPLEAISNISDASWFPKRHEEAE